MAPIVAFAADRQVVFNGLVAGITYGVLAVGLILVYRASRVLNLVHAEIGAFAAALVARMVINWHINFGVAVVVSVLVGGLFGAALELSVVRRLARAPRVIVMVATLGITQLVLLAQLKLPRLVRFDRYPTPFRSTWRIGGILVRSEHMLILVIVPVLVACLSVFLNRTRIGTAIRAAAANLDAARLSAINVRGLSTLVWALAGMLAALTAILIAPIKGSTAATTLALGPSLLVRALVPALIARLRSMPIALVAGAGIGIMEALLFFNFSTQPGLIDAVLFVVVVIAIIAVVRNERPERSAWMATPRGKAIPTELLGLWWIRRLRQIFISLLIVIVVIAPLVIDRPSRHMMWARIAIYSLVGLSLTVLSGWAGQLSLGQFALVGLSGMLTAAFTNGLEFRVGSTLVQLHPLPFGVAALIGVIFTVLVALGVGAPALRTRGLFLAVTTLAFAVMAQTWLLERPLLTGGESIAFLGRASWGERFSLQSQRSYYYLCVAVLIVGAVVLGRIRRSGIGRSMIAVRENETGAAALSVSPTRIKIVAFGISGAYAGVAGALFVSLVGQLDPGQLFTPDESLRSVSIAVIGGLGSIAGAILGALWVIGLPAFFEDAAEVKLLASGIGVVILLMYLPGGLAQIGYAARDGVFGWLAGRVSRPAPVPIDRTAMPARARVRRQDEAPLHEAPIHAGLASDALMTNEVGVNFGGRAAVDGVSIRVGRGEIVGLIGTNGAGKSTLMNAVGGFVAYRGSISMLGLGIDGVSAAGRARRGLGRSFQGAELFGDLTIRETIQLALEARDRTALFATMLATPGARRAERHKVSEAEELVSFFGLGRYADHFVSDLSTGTRRIVELACLLALDAQVLCLDEPTAGVAQRETEAFAPLLLRVRDELDASLLVIEHDMPFVMGISDRVYCLEAGRIIAEGTPVDVRQDPLVIGSYLGTDTRAIDRSGVSAV